MNNLIPNWVAGETMAALIVERMQKPERDAVSQVHEEWKYLTDHSDEKCKAMAVKIVDGGIDHRIACLIGCFNLLEDHDAHLKRLKEFSEQKRMEFIRSFERFSQSELEALTSDSACKLMAKNREIAKKVSGYIARGGASMLFRSLLRRKKVTQLPDKQDSIVQLLVNQHLRLFSNGIVHGTYWNMRRLSILHPFESEYKATLKKLEDKSIEDELFTSLKNAYSDDLTVHYESRFDEDQLIELYKLKSRTVYKSIGNIIGKDLHRESVKLLPANF